MIKNSFVLFLIVVIFLPSTYVLIADESSEDAFLSEIDKKGLTWDRVRLNSLFDNGNESIFLSNLLKRCCEKLDLKVNIEGMRRVKIKELSGAIFEEDNEKAMKLFIKSKLKEHNVTTRGNVQNGFTFISSNDDGYEKDLLLLQYADNFYANLFKKTNKNDLDDGKSILLLIRNEEGESIYLVLITSEFGSNRRQLYFGATFDGVKLNISTIDATVDDLLLLRGVEYTIVKKMIPKESELVKKYKDFLKIGPVPIDFDSLKNIERLIK